MKIHKNPHVILNPIDSELKYNIIDLKDLPKVSIVIPTLNNTRTIEKCLKSISRQEYPKIEIIIVDNGSIDDTLMIARKYTDKIFSDKGKLGSVRQTGIEHATGDIIGSFDSDIELPNNKWLINAIKYFNYSPDVVSIWPANIAPPDASLNLKLYWNLWRIIIHDRITKNRGLFGGGNSLFLKTFLEEVGGLERNYHWGEDYNLANKIRDHGGRLIFIDNPIYHDTNMGSYIYFIKKQIIGANTFLNTGFRHMGLTNLDIIYEQFILGFKGMIKGIIFNHDPSWFLFPVFLSLRVISYLIVYCHILYKKIIKIMVGISS